MSSQTFPFFSGSKNNEYIYISPNRSSVIYLHLQQCKDTKHYLAMLVFHSTWLCLTDLPNVEATTPLQQDPALLADLEQAGFSTADAKQMIRRATRS